MYPPRSLCSPIERRCPQCLAMSRAGILCSAPLSQRLIWYCTCPRGKTSSRSRPCYLLPLHIFQRHTVCNLHCCRCLPVARSDQMGTVDNCPRDRFPSQTQTFQHHIRYSPLRCRCRSHSQTCRLDTRHSRPLSSNRFLPGKYHLSMQCRPCIVC